MVKRILDAGWQGFKRSANLSVTCCFVLVLATSLVGGLVLTKNVADFLIEEAKEKADISVYLKQGSNPDQAFELKEELGTLSGVEEVEIKSKEEALEEFVERHKDDETLMQSLAEVGSNPFLASLNVRAGDMAGLEKVAGFLENDKFSGVIERVDYHRRKPVIEKIFDFSRFIERAGLILAIVFISVAAFLSFNTIRLAIRARRREISIMRLVGGSNAFISGPFLVQGLISGLAAFVLSFGLVAGLSYILTPRIGAFFPGFRIFTFFRENMRTVALYQLASSLILALVPSFLAVRRYLKT